MALLTSPSPRGVRETADRVVESLERRGVSVLARIDHGGAARAAGLKLADEELLIFGDPRVGTLLMQSDPEVGYELPLRLLVWDERGQTKIAYRPARELAAEYELGDATAVVERIDGLLAQIVAESTEAA
jgi:uncharacterized protein (DUF302 family)